MFDKNDLTNAEKAKLFDEIMADLLLPKSNITQPKHLYGVLIQVYKR